MKRDERKICPNRQKNNRVDPMDKIHLRTTPKLFYLHVVLLVSRPEFQVRAQSYSELTVY